MAALAGSLWTMLVPKMQGPTQAEKKRAFTQLPKAFSVPQHALHGVRLWIIWQALVVPLARLLVSMQPIFFFNRGARDAEGVALTSAIVSQSSSQADAILRMYGQELVRRGPAKAGGAVCERWVAFETPLRRRTSHETSAC